MSLESLKDNKEVLVSMPIRFKDINHWLHFVRDASIKQLEDIIKSDFYLCNFLDNKEDIRVNSDLMLNASKNLRVQKLKMDSGQKL